MDKEHLNKEREEILYQINETLDTPLIFLSILWLVLIIIDLIYGLPPFLQTLNSVIWAIFIIDFIIELYIAPRKRAYLRNNWLSGISLLLPPLRILKLFRASRIIKVVRVGQSFNLSCPADLIIQQEPEGSQEHYEKKRDGICDGPYNTYNSAWCGGNV